MSASSMRRSKLEASFRRAPRDKEFAAKLAAIDARDAEAYAAMEVQVSRVRELAEEIEQDGVPMLQITDNDSVVNHIEAARASGTWPKAEKPTKP